MDRLVNVVRDLNVVEELFTKFMKNNQFKNPRVFLIQSEFDLFEHQAEVKQAIGIWIQLHPLLQCKIVEIPGDYGRSKSVFVKRDESETYLDDVLFMEYKSTNTTSVPWQYLIEYELTHKFDSTKWPMWRIKFVKLNEENRYGLIVHFHHALTDGTNSYNITLELLRIIEDVHYSNRRDCSGLDVQRYEYGFPNDPRNGVEFPSDYYETVNKNQVITDVLVPDCFKPTEEESINECQTDCDGVFVSTDDSLSVSVKDIVKNRSTHDSRIKTMEIDKELFENLLRKIKQKGVKLTGFLECVLAFALLKLYNHYSVGNPDKLKWAVTGSIRKFFEPSVDNFVMGGAQWTVLFYNELNENQRDLVDFWNNAKQKSNDLHDYINSRVYFTSEAEVNKQIGITSVLNGYLRTKDVGTHYTITNLGVTNQSLLPNANIKVNEYYSFLSKSTEETLALVFNSFCSINGRLFWSYTYNGAYIGPSKMQFWEDSIIETMKFLVAVD